MRGARGYTIMEVAVVLAIIAISAAVALPSLIRQGATDRLGGAARQVMGDFLWARMQAVTQRNAFRVFFVNEHRYRILDDDDNDGQADTGEWTEVRDIRERYPDVRLTTTANPIFFPRGSASAGTVTLTNPGGSRRVKVHITGRVKIG